MNAPKGLHYTSTDEWVKVEGKIATVGITDYAQDQLSDIVFVEILVSPGDNISKGGEVASIESVKAAADVNCPVNGKVLEVNEKLSSSPELVNTDPYGTAWMIKVELSDPSELNQLMDASAYEKNCSERSH
jgi:glycine cleavage system H protein